jgi:hypothetical protein
MPVMLYHLNDTSRGSVAASDVMFLSRFVKIRHLVQILLGNGVGASYTDVIILYSLHLLIKYQESNVKIRAFPPRKRSKLLR